MKKKECFECHGKSRKKVREYAIFSTEPSEKTILKKAQLILLCDSCAFKLLYAQTKQKKE